MVEGLLLGGPWLGRPRWPRTAWWEQSRTEGCFKEMGVARVLCSGAWPRAGAQLWGEQTGAQESLGGWGSLRLTVTRRCRAAKAGPRPHLLLEEGPSGVPA